MNAITPIQTKTINGTPVKIMGREEIDAFGFCFMSIIARAGTPREFSTVICSRDLIVPESQSVEDCKFLEGVVFGVVTNKE